MQQALCRLWFGAKVSAYSGIMPKGILPSEVIALAAKNVEIKLYAELQDLSHFNPDLDLTVPRPVIAFSIVCSNNIGNCYNPTVTDKI